MITLFGVSSAILIILLYIFTHNTFSSGEKVLKINPKTFFTIVAAAFLLRICAALIWHGHETDMACFSAWADDIFQNGFRAFYSSESFSDYPPGYMYILYIIGAVRSIFHIYGEWLIKIPAIICDMLCSLLIFRTASGNKKLQLFSFVFFLFNPAVILNSAIWGQVDSIFTFFVLLTILLLHRNKTIPAYFTFAFSVFIKPQALFYTPVILFSAYEQIFDGFSTKKLIKHITAAFCALFVIIILCIPFGVKEVALQYIDTVASYNFASVNAYNLWTALGMNWQELTPAMSILGTFSIVLITAASGYIFFGIHHKNRHFSASAFLCFSVFMLSVKIHDRYAYPAIALSLCAFALSGKKSDLILCSGICLSQFLNTAHVLFGYVPEDYYTGNFRTFAVLFSVFSLCVFVYMLKNVFTKNTKLQIPKKTLKTNSKITANDCISIFLITLIYTAAAFFNLGNTHAPQSGICLDSETFLVDFEENTDISMAAFYLGEDELNEDNTLTLDFFDDEKNPVYKIEFNSGDVFCWNYIDEINISARYVQIVANSSVYINEAAFFDMYGNAVIPNKPSPLFDEQEKVPEYQSYKNGTYFDEIYHARTAYEFLNGGDIYEWTHPPLGKLFISAGIKLFGMTPFGWRFSGTLFGILMLPAIYMLIKHMFKSTAFSACGTLAFAFDFMHFTQSRIATIDVFVTFFILLMYLFMYKYYTMSFYDVPLKKTFLPLGACGICFGLACACKWTGVYAGAGIAVIFFMTLFERYTEKNPHFAEKTAKTLLFCILFFVIIPLLIYTASYIPYLECTGEGFYGIIQNQIDMLTYHGKTVITAEHPYSSVWYQWPIIFRPIWYFSGNVGTKTSDISAMGNPAVWWFGILSFFICVKNFKTDKNARFLTIAYLAQLVPWIFVSRTTFIYHYFPCVPFVSIMNVYVLYNAFKKNPAAKKYLYVYTACAIMLFLLFYPAISGFPVNSGYVQNVLRWLPSWQLTK